MPCDHKFKNHLTLEKIKFSPKILIIGTFNPSWNVLGNQAEWFYGRTGNNYFWQVLPNLLNKPSLIGATHKDWKIFCELNEVALTDIITSIVDANIDSYEHISALEKYEDTKITKFKTFVFTDVIGILQKHPTIKTVLFTRQSDGGFWDRSWLPISTYCNKNKIKCEMLLSPSKNSRFQMVKGSGQKLPDFILDDWINKYYF